MMPRFVAASKDSWVLVGAAFDRDYITGQTFGDAADTCVRSDPAFAIDSKGNWHQFNENVARQTDLGVLVEPEGTSGVFNSRFVGCFPPNWLGPTISIVQPAGMNAPQVIGTPIYQGLPAIELLITGTPTIGGTFTIAFGATTAYAVQPGDIAVNSAFLALTGGDLTNVLKFNIAGVERSAMGTQLALVFPSSSLELSSTLERQRWDREIQLADTKFWQMLLRANFAPAPISFKIVIACPQAELNVQEPSSPIYNPEYDPQVNLVPNPTFTGGVPGTSQLPTGYSNTGNFPFNVTYVGIQTVSGKDCMILDFAATFGSSFQASFFTFEPLQTIAAKIGDNFISQFEIALLSGTTPAMGMTFREQNGTSQEGNQNFPVISGLTSELQSKFAQYNTAVDDVTNIQTGFFLNPLPNTSYAFRLALYLPQLDKNHPVATVAPTRAADVFDAAPPVLNANEGTLQLEFAPVGSTGIYDVIALTDGTNSAKISYPTVDSMVLQVTGIQEDLEIVNCRLANLLPSRIALSWSAKANETKITLNGRSTITRAGTLPFTAPPTVVQGTDANVRRITGWTSALDAKAMEGNTASGKWLRQFLGSGQSNGEGSHGFVDYLLGTTSFYLPAHYWAPSFGVPKQLMFAILPTPLTVPLFTNFVRIADVRFGANFQSGAALETDMQVLPEYLRTFTPSISRQWITSSAAVTVIENMARKMAKFYGPDTYVLATSNAVGGASIRSMTEFPTQPFANNVVPFEINMTAVQRANDFAKVQGFKHEVVAWVNNGHQQDGDQPIETTTSNWELQRLSAIQRITAITGQANPPIFIGNLFGNFQNNQPNAVTGNFILSQTTPWIMFGQEYAWMTLNGMIGYYGDNVHLNARGEAYSGERCANAAIEVLTKGVYTQNCRCLSATRNGVNVRLNYQVPVPPLVLDDVNVTDPTNYGIPGLKGVYASLADGVTINPLVSITPDASGFDIVLTTDAPSIIYVAMYGYTTPFNTFYVQTEQPRACFRDSSPEVFDYNGANNWNWVEPQTIVVN